MGIIGRTDGLVGGDDDANAVVDVADDVAIEFMAAGLKIFDVYSI
jgi:hypothetical protein